MQIPVLSKDFCTGLLPGFVESKQAQKIARLAQKIGTALYNFWKVTEVSFSKGSNGKVEAVLAES